MTKAPAAVAFDVIGTMLNLEPLRERLSGIGQPPHALGEWYARTVRDGMALAATGDYAEFHDVAASALREMTGARDEQIARVLSGFSDLPAHPDALAALKRLADADVRVALLSNGSPKALATFASRSGIEEYVDRMISVGEVRRWKPSPIVYRYAAELLDVPPGGLALVAAHPWDIHGAKRAGLMAAYVGRDGRGFPPIFASPDVTAPDLVSAVEALLTGPAEARDAVPRAQRDPR